nr:MAG TPA: hypothetical protein [Caudoviricetes sp.]
MFRYENYIKKRNKVKKGAEPARIKGTRFPKRE